MSRYRSGVSLFAGLVLISLAPVAWPAPLQLTLYLNEEARQFLSSANQRILVVLPTPASQDATVVVAQALEPPLADSTTLQLELDAALYVSMRPVEPLQAITPGVSQRVADGQAYSFNGYRIDGEGTGLAGYFSLYFNAPANAQPVAAGLSGFIYSSASGKPARPSPTRYSTLQMFQTQVMPRTTPQVWILVGSGIDTGTRLPLALLKPVAPQAFQVAGAYGTQSGLTLSRYREVTLSAANNSSVHFDPALNAFVEGPYLQGAMSAAGDTVTLLKRAQASR